MPGAVTLHAYLVRNLGKRGCERTEAGCKAASLLADCLGQAAEDSAEIDDPQVALSAVDCVEVWCRAALPSFTALRRATALPAARGAQQKLLRATAAVAKAAEWGGAEAVGRLRKAVADDAGPLAPRLVAATAASDLQPLRRQLLQEAAGQLNDLDVAAAAVDCIRAGADCSPSELVEVIENRGLWSQAEAFAAAAGPETFSFSLPFLHSGLGSKKRATRRLAAALVLRQLGESLSGWARVHSSLSEQQPFHIVEPVLARDGGEALGGRNGTQLVAALLYAAQLHQDSRVHRAVCVASAAAFGTFSDADAAAAGRLIVDLWVPLARSLPADSAGEWEGAVERCGVSKLLRAWIALGDAPPPPLCRCAAAVDFARESAVELLAVVAEASPQCRDDARRTDLAVAALRAAAVCKGDQAVLEALRVAGRACATDAPPRSALAVGVLSPELAPDSVAIATGTSNVNWSLRAIACVAPATLFTVAAGLSPAAAIAAVAPGVECGALQVLDGAAGMVCVLQSSTNPRTGAAAAVEITVAALVEELLRSPATCGPVTSMLPPDGAAAATVAQAVLDRFSTACTVARRGGSWEDVDVAATAALSVPRKALRVRPLWGELIQLPQPGAAVLELAAVAARMGAAGQGGAALLWISGRLPQSPQRQRGTDLESSVMSRCSTSAAGSPRLGSTWRPEEDEEARRSMLAAVRSGAAAIAAGFGRKEKEALSALVRIGRLVVALPVKSVEFRLSLAPLAEAIVTAGAGGLSTLDADGMQPVKAMLDRSSQAASLLASAAAPVVTDAAALARLMVLSPASGNAVLAPSHPCAVLVDAADRACTASSLITALLAYLVDGDLGGGDVSERAVGHQRRVRIWWGVTALLRQASAAGDADSLALCARTALRALTDADGPPQQRPHPRTRVLIQTAWATACALNPDEVDGVCGVLDAPETAARLATSTLIVAAQLLLTSPRPLPPQQRVRLIGSCVPWSHSLNHLARITGDLLLSHVLREGDAEAVSAAGYLGNLTKFLERNKHLTHLRDRVRLEQLITECATDAAPPLSPQRAADQVMQKALKFSSSDWAEVEHGPADDDGQRGGDGAAALQLRPGCVAGRGGVGRDEVRVCVVGSFLSNLPNQAGLCRTLECLFGSAGELLLPSRGVLKEEPFQRVSMTSENWLSIEEVPEGGRLVDYLKDMKCRGFTVVALEQTATSEPAADVELPERMVLVVGNEQRGIPASFLAAGLIDTYVEIPHLGVTRSMNAHVSVTAMLWQHRLRHP
eukprot:TRINITY_DN6941_c1_g2_i1.p1 TRINITY_DN6941_c1_g2~~TRINITY_DN6941_c1_g2_i1.p1  ORF type:complete len:1285 (+),score=385.78 TRINITY_DN6941_c1_g2_i1:59-3856(+)